MAETSMWQEKQMLFDATVDLCDADSRLQNAVALGDLENLPKEEAAYEEAWSKYLIAHQAVSDRQAQRGG